MYCRRCGRNNPPNARHCVYCGASLKNSNNKRKSQKQTESVIVALIIIMVLLLVIVAGVFIYRNNNSGKGGFGSGGGGSYIPHITNQQGSPTQTPMPDVEEEPDEESSYTPPSSNNNAKLEKKNMFLDKADEIEQYAEDYLETATSQSEMNSESYTVYKKWDDLLNEVYQYLKTILPEYQFEQLEDDEIDWIAEKESAIDAAGAEWEGGSGESFVRNVTAIEYTEERCYYLISLIN